MSTSAATPPSSRTAYVVLVTSILARLPQGMAPLAVVLLVQERTGSIAAAGVAAGAWGLCAAAGQPLWARPAGQGRAERVIALASLSQAAIVTVLALSSIDAIGPLIAMAGLGGLLAAPTSPVARTLWPELAEDQHRLDALFTLDATSQELIFIAGPTTVAVLVAVSGPSAALLAAAACGAIGGLAFAYVVRPIWRPHPRTSGRARLGRALVAPFTVLFLVAFGIGLIEVGVPAAAILDGNRSASGWLLAAWSLGSLVGGVISSRIRWRGGPAQRMSLLLGLITIGSLFVANAWQFGLGWLGAALFIAGLALAPTLAASYGVIGDAAPVERRTDAFAWAVTFLLLGLGVGPTIGGVLAEVTPTLTFLAGTVITMVALVAWLTLAPRKRAS